MGSEGEQDITQISLHFQGLSISVTRSRAPAPVVGPNPDTLPSESGVGSTPCPSAKTLIPEPVPEEEPASSSSCPGPSAFDLRCSLSGPLASPSAARSPEKDFPEVPSAWLVSAKVLRAKGFSGEARIRRAWTAGCWARAVLEGRARTPSPTPNLDLPNKHYAVARSSNGSPPEIYNSIRDYRIAVDHLSATVSLSQGFPSELECRVYLDAAGIKTFLPSL